MEKGKSKFIIWGLCLVFLVCGKISANPDSEHLRKLFTNQLLEAPVNEERVKDVLSSCQEDGTWPGIDYQDTSRIGFQHERHLSNMLLLSCAYRQKECKYKGNKQVKAVLMRSLDYWLQHDFICENWWWNQIGTPNTIVAMLLILDKDLSATQSGKMLDIVGRGNVNASGARPSGDRIKIAGLQAKAALFKKDDRELEDMIRIIEGEIKFSTERGMQHDYSFHHREDWVNNTLSYGSGYAEAFAEWAANVAGTKYRFSDKSLRLLVDYYLDGMCKQMIFGKFTDPGVANRDITRPGDGRMWSNKTPERLLALTDYRREELERILKLRKGENGVPESFAKFFWRTDHFVFQRPRFYTSVRMYSTRNANMEEPYNGEGLMNHFRGDGTNYLSLTGKEYADLAPVYNWMKIPGATVTQLKEMPAENEIQKWGLTDFVGAVTDGRYGAVAFHFKSPHTGLKAKKAWFFFDEEYICLGADITGRQALPVVTTLDQCRLAGDVQVKDATGIHPLESGSHQIEHVSWALHGNVGYIFPEAQQVSVSNREETGSWYQVNRQTSSSKEIVREKVFNLGLNHGVRPANASYAYIVLPGTDSQILNRYQNEQPVKVLTNTPDLQAVRHDKLRIAYAVFYKGGTVGITDNLSVTMDSPGLLLIRYTEKGEVQTLAVADPTHFLKRLHLSVNQENFAVDLPQAEYAGKSVVVCNK